MPSVTATCLQQTSTFSLRLFVCTDTSTRMCHDVLLDQISICKAEAWCYKWRFVLAVAVIFPMHYTFLKGVSPKLFFRPFPTPIQSQKFGSLKVQLQSSLFLLLSHCRECEKKCVSAKTLKLVQPTASGMLLLFWEPPALGKYYDSCQTFLWVREDRWTRLKPTRIGVHGISLVTSHGTACCFKTAHNAFCDTGRF